MKPFLKVLSSRIFIIVVLLAVQIVLLVGLIWRLSNYFAYFYFLFILISIVVVLFIINRDYEPAYKLAWVVPILLFPVFGGFLYLIFSDKRTTKAFKQNVRIEFAKAICFLHQDQKILEELEAEDREIAFQSNYLSKTCSFPVYQNTVTQYLSPGEMFFDKLTEELEKAKHFIFMEYFIVEEGFMWNRILDILAQKAKDGLDVRMMYDDAGCLQTLPYKYNEKLAEMGIKTMVFQPFTPRLTARLNNRDHRKITVIDGHTGFCGGINLADEYINRKERFGHWKDASLYLKGDAAWNLTFLFLHTWNSWLKCEDDYASFLPHVYHPEDFASDGFVQPFGDSPLEDEPIGEMVYLNLINKARDYVYINTPYLVCTQAITTALMLAAKNGVEIIIVTPHIADKWYVHSVTMASYEKLISAGVKIYEYTPGFMHSKTFLADDKVGVVGTVNMDYRSFYLHFECGVWLYNTSSLLELKQDFLKCLKISEMVTLAQCKSVPFSKKILRAVLKLFAPLM